MPRMPRMRRARRRDGFCPTNPCSRQADRHPPFARPDREPSRDADRQAQPGLARVEVHAGEQRNAAVIVQAHVYAGS